MTICTFGPQRAIVLVVFLVANRTFLACLLEHGAFMARLAFDLGVLAKQGKDGLGMIKLGRFLPRFFCMTARAVAPEAFLVFVVFAMAGIAILTGFHPIKIAQMARTALGNTMLSKQCIFRVLVVVKNDIFPCLGAMAAFTFVTILPFVAFLIIIFLVASETVFRRILVDPLAMAVIAFGVDVLAGQFKLRLGVVKFRLFPGHFRVAIHTCGA